MFVPYHIQFLRLYFYRSHGNNKKEIISQTNHGIIIDNMVTTKKK